MAINDIPVRLDKAFFVSVASDFQKARETDDSGRETGREVNRENYDGDSYALDIQISAYVEERGMRALTSQAVTLEVPIEKSDEVLKRLQALPEMTEVKFDALSVRAGVSKRGSLYTMWTARGMEPVRQVAARAAAQA